MQDDSRGCGGHHKGGVCCEKVLHKLKSSTLPPGVQKPTLVDPLQNVASHDT